MGKIWQVLKEILGLVPKLYSLIKPGSLSLPDQSIEIAGRNLTYVFKYKLKKPRYSLWLSKKAVVLELGPDIKLVDLGIVLPPTVSITTGYLGVDKFDVTARVHEALSPYFRSLKDGNEITITAITRFDISKYVQRKTIVTRPERQEILFKNLLPHPVKQYEVYLDVTEPRQIRSIEILRGEEDIGQNKRSTIETHLVRYLKISDIPSEFPDGISGDCLVSSPKRDVSSHMKFFVDFQTEEEIKIVIYR